MSDLVVTPESLETYWNESMGLLAANGAFSREKQEFFENFLRMADWENFDTNLYLANKSWELKIKEHLYHHLLTETLTGVLLYRFGVAEIPAWILSTIIHVMTSARKVEFTPSEESVYLQLTIDKEFQGLHSSDEWYDHLPPEVRKQTNPMDFEDMIDKLVYAGLAEKREDGVIVYGEGKHKLRIHVSWD